MKEWPTTGWATPAEASEFLNVPVSTVGALLRSKPQQLPGRKIGRLWRLPWAELHRMTETIPARGLKTYVA